MPPLDVSVLQTLVVSCLCQMPVIDTTLKEDVFQKEELDSPSGIECKDRKQDLYHTDKRSCACTEEQDGGTPGPPLKGHYVIT